MLILTHINESIQNLKNLQIKVILDDFEIKIAQITSKNSSAGGDLPNHIKVLAESYKSLIAKYRPINTKTVGELSSTKDKVSIALAFNTLSNIDKIDLRLIESYGSDAYLHFGFKYNEHDKNLLGIGAVLFNKISEE